MRILKFIANGQQLTKDPSCDFSGIVRGIKFILKEILKWQNLRIIHKNHMFQIMIPF